MSADHYGSIAGEIADAGAKRTAAAEFPLTCNWCRRQPARHLAIADWLMKGQTATRREENMLCTPCAQQTSILPGEVVSWWLFDLTVHDYDKEEWPS